MRPTTKDNLLVAVGLFGILGFLYLYTVKLFGQHGKPLTSAFIETYIGRPGLIILNIVIFASFLALLAYRRLSAERAWKSKGAFIGFLIALVDPSHIDTFPNSYHGLLPLGSQGRK